MLGFETLTLAPIDRRLIVVAMLTAEERAQLDAYHARVLEVVARWSPPTWPPGWRTPARRSDGLDNLQRFDIVKNTDQVGSQER